VLMQSDVRKVVVRGEVSMVQGRMTIQAQSVQALTSDCESGK